ncbi:hypothetical protein LPJ61_006751, partial [Coemansia biformis]
LAVANALELVGVTDEARQVQLALLHVSPMICRDWDDYCRTSGIAGKGTLPGLVRFLTANFETACTSFMASESLKVLQFRAEDDILAFGKEFAKTLTLAGIAGTDAHALDLFRGAMPPEIQRELFVETITTLRQAMDTATRKWHLLRSLAAAQRRAPAVEGPELMEIDRMQKRVVEHRSEEGLAYDAD